MWWSLTWYNYGDRVVMTSNMRLTRRSVAQPYYNSPFACNAMLFMPAETVIHFLHCDSALVTSCLLRPHAPLSA